MRRRLVVAMLLLVSAALMVAGAGSQLLVRQATLDDARQDVARQAEQFARVSDDLRRPALLAALRRALRLSGADVVRFSPRGRLLTELPSGISSADLRASDLAVGATVSGIRGTLVYAVAPVPNATGGVVGVVLTRELRALNRGFGFFLLAALVSLGFAALLGRRIGRRIALPLEVAAAGTRAIAAGDLAARIALPANADPEVASLAASISSLAANLERSRAAERDFLLSVSHDLRTPLTAIRGYGEALADGAIDDSARAGAVITNESRRLERLVGDLLELARLGAGSFALTPSEVRLEDVVAGTAEALQLAAADAGIVLTAPAASDAVVVADPDRLAQVVANLIENALAYATATVDVTITTTDGVAGFAVEDDGPGIPAAEQAAVFARHYRSDRGRHVGTGLGLAIVAELVAAMGGTVTVASPRPSGLPGTRLAVELPAIPPSGRPAPPEPR
ncbi:MAG: HAMP domain-containing histidine kinase [Actinobacteria bacterium]|nr:HAMP domain-containing histidine kinase [Actinomycetota bacterium]